MSEDLSFEAMEDAIHPHRATIRQLQAERDAALADAAALREVLDFYSASANYDCWPGQTISKVHGDGGSAARRILRSLRSTAGADLLERLQRAESEIATWKKTHSEMVSFLGSEGGKLLDRAQKAEAQRDALVAWIEGDIKTYNNPIAQWSGDDLVKSLQEALAAAVKATEGGE